jgi:ribosome-associated toxin RatA of RatAB toxin-antitoxin module
METQISRRVRADTDLVFRLAAAVEDWPRILPHYRWVKVREADGARRVVDMAARRDAIPVRWVAEQRVLPSEQRITFRHIGGITRGMEVAWTFAPQADGTVLVRIWHRFCPRWPLVPAWLVQRVVGNFFVDDIARKTLTRLAQLSEHMVAERA